mmetsp:Transcript_8363/g.25896  ORF Transcript_8363/g.25896 Transcript_8363/m.25896 type:complete len:82 (+) Transcript_8363:662-907(+)
MARCLEHTDAESPQRELFVMCKLTSEFWNAFVATNHEDGRFSVVFLRLQSGDEFCISVGMVPMVMRGENRCDVHLLPFGCL